MAFITRTEEDVKRRQLEIALAVINNYNDIKTGRKQNTAELLRASKSAATTAQKLLNDGNLPYEITYRQDFHAGLHFFLY